MYTNYLKLKDKGDQGELAFADFLSENNFTNIEHVDDIAKKDPSVSRSDFDIKATNEIGVTLTYEIKTQDDCHTWGTINIEQVQSGKPAGIATSKADVWVFVNKELGFGMVQAEDLKKIHWAICKDPTVQKKSYKDKVKRGDIQLWITKYKNFAAGFRIPNERVTWFKSTNK